MLEQTIKRALTLVLLALVVVAPLASSRSDQTEFLSKLRASQPWLYGPVCNALDTDLTTYNHTVDVINQVTSGVTIPHVANVAVVAMGEDTGSASFNVSSVVVDGVSLVERIDEDGTGVVNAALYTTNTPQSGTASVAVDVTYSEAITGSVVCVWLFDNLAIGIPSSSVQDDDTASGALVLTTSVTNVGGFVVAGCINSGVADSATWGVLTERVDTQSAEYDYSAADGANTGSSMSNTCDWSGGNDASGVAASMIPFVRQSWPTITFVDSVTDADGGSINSPYTFTAASTGVAHASRMNIVACANIDGDFGGQGNVTAMTINGVSATEATGGCDGGDNNLCADLYYASNPTGTTGNIVITMSGDGGDDGIACSIYAAYNLRSTTPNNVAEAESDGTSLGAQDIRKYGIGVFFGSGCNFGGTPDSVWTNPSETDEQIFGGAGDCAIATGFTGPVTEGNLFTPNINVNDDYIQLLGAYWR